MNGSSYSATNELFMPRLSTALDVKACRIFAVRDVKACRIYAALHGKCYFGKHKIVGKAFGNIFLEWKCSLKVYMS